MRNAPREVPERGQPYKHTPKSLSWQYLLSRWGSGAHRHEGVSLAAESDHVPRLHRDRQGGTGRHAGRHGETKRTFQHGIETSVRAHRLLPRMRYPKLYETAVVSVSHWD